jgi:small neutral amino acid transporter SnatA (MarC family)
MHENVESPESIGAVPIAMSLLVGPGAINHNHIYYSTI